MNEYMLNQGDEVMVNSTAEGVERVRNSRGGYAFILGNPGFISRKKSGLVLKIITVCTYKTIRFRDLQTLQQTNLKINKLLAIQ